MSDVIDELIEKKLEIEAILTFKTGDRLSISFSAAWLFDDGIKRCYDDLGCFTMGGDFAKRPVQLLPLGPSVIKTK